MANTDISTQKQMLPDTLPDLAKFVLVGREKLSAARAAIRAIDKVKVAEEVRKQKLIEAQEIAEAVTDAEVRMGELLRKIPKASGGDHGNQHTGGKISPALDFASPTKQQTVSSIGITQRQSEQFQLMANNPESVEKAKAKARQNGDVLSRRAVLNQIVDDAPKTKPVIKAVVDRAKEEHAQFVEQKAAKAVDIADIRRDKENMDTLAFDLEREIRRALNNINALDLFRRADEFVEIAKAMPEADLRMLIDDIQDGVNILHRLQAFLMEGVE